MPRVRHTGPVASILTARGGAVGDAPEFVAATTSTNGANNTANVTINKPAGVVAGDIFLTYIGASNYPGFEPPAGWFSLARSVSISSRGSEVFAKIADGSEGASFTFSPGGSSSKAAILAAYRPKQPTALYLDQMIAPVYHGSTSSFSTPLLVPRRKSRLIIFAGQTSGTTTATTPAGTTQRATDNVSTWRCYLFDCLAPKGEAISKSGTWSIPISNGWITALLL